LEQLMTVEELVHHLRLTRRTIYRMLKRGVIPAYKVGKEWRFEKESIYRWLRQNEKGAKTRILVIDDEPMVTSLFRRTLERSGHLVITAETGADGIQHFRQEDFDLIFLDLKLPDIEGDEVLRDLREIRPDVKVICMTGYPESDLIQRVLEQGPIGIMMKPFTTTDIIHAVNGVLFVGLVK